MKAAVNKELENQRAGQGRGGKPAGRGHPVCGRRAAGPSNLAGQRATLRPDHLDRDPGAAVGSSGRRGGQRSRRPQAESGQVDPRQVRSLLAPSRDVGQHAAHPDLCGRCIENIEGSGGFATMPDVDRFGRLPWLWITVLVFVLDQVSKGVLPGRTEHAPADRGGPDLFQLDLLSYNTGAAVQLPGRNSGWQRWLFSLIAIVVSAILVVWLEARLKKGENLVGHRPTALVLGGALGNFDPHGPAHVVDLSWRTETAGTPGVLQPEADNHHRRRRHAGARHIQTERNPEKPAHG